MAVFYAFFTLIIVNTVWFSFSEKATEIGVVNYEEEEEENGEKKKRAVSLLIGASRSNQVGRIFDLSL